MGGRPEGQENFVDRRAWTERADGRRGRETRLTLLVPHSASALPIPPHASGRRAARAIDPDP